MRSDARSCVVGAGIIGGFLGTHLALEGNARLSALARGATLVALRDHGWRLEEGGALAQAPVARAADDPRELGPQDLVVIAVEEPGAAGARPDARAAAGGRHRGAAGDERRAVVVRRGNCRARSATTRERRPRGRISAAIASARVVGCVVHASATSCIAWDAV